MNLKAKGVSLTCVHAPVEPKGVTGDKYQENNDIEWVSPSKASQIDGVSRRTIHRRCDRGEYIWKQGATKGGDGRLIKKASLYNENKDLCDSNKGNNTPCVARCHTFSAPSAAPLSNSIKKQGNNNAGDTPENGVCAPQNVDKNPEKWLCRDDVMRFTDWSKRTFQRRCSDGDVVCRNDGTGYIVYIDSLPPQARARYYAHKVGHTDPKQFAREAELAVLNAAPDYSRKQAFKYLTIFHAADGLRGEKLKLFIQQWNAEYPDLKTSYNMVKTMQRDYKEHGVSALLAGWGTNEGRTVTDDDCFVYFKDNYLVQSGGNIETVWLRTLGYAKTVLGLDVDAKSIGSPSAYYRRLKKEVGEPAIYRARYGEQAYNRKYGGFVQTWNNAKAGQVWVSDHMQVDLLCYDGRLPFDVYQELAYAMQKMTKKQKAARKPVRPWLTVWRDMRTNKWVGWNLHAEAPNSDHIMQSLYNAIVRYGIPEYIYIDNGKDYRAKHFSGGRTKVKLKVNETIVTGLTAAIGIKVIFCTPYNPQAKPIERDFRNFHGWFERGLPGYTGSTVVDKPEILNEQVKNGEILEFHDVQRLVDHFIVDILNKTQSKGRTLAGRSPDEAWAKEFTGLPSIDSNELKLYCTRISSTKQISRNGWLDPDIGWYYYAEWMAGYMGQRAYMRRDPQKYQTGWFFLERSDEFIGQAPLIFPTPKLAMDDIQREQVQEAIRRKNRQNRLNKEAGNPATAFERAMHHAAGLATTEDLGNKAQSNEVRITPAAAALEKAEQMRKTGTWDMPLADMEPDYDDEPQKVVRLIDD